ncbi:type II toxin-antitoxin system RelE/ParE family toxin [Nitrosomonas sp. H1_AOB3]|uniref:type II toxin-antitoxin system RelE/ParE family toxin n=1 Tax=Nitrosomonas sp. H1_AOB3 TaxID=2741553 RepID=UPI001938ECD7|nr:type II toxin-antitoxin system RelE/ParE family toxin [Nitrosomonas sp. H1_AOB3]QOJ09280.1 MAG: type II toxin-antitoxin system RelE/ParE family toxin [Nitrosomonas sp. H1_AOB3]
MIVVWTPEAEQDWADIWDYIAADNPGAAGVKRFVTPRFSPLSNHCVIHLPQVHFAIIPALLSY